MASSSSSSSSSMPIRSNSLPARSHPTTHKIEQTINKLKSRPVCSSDVSGAESIHLGLLNLVELYANVQGLVQTLSTQQGKLIEEALESSVLVLDACSSARDLISGFREQVCDLQSALRRKGHSSTEKEISMYLSFRKNMAKDVARCLKVLKQAEAKYGITAPQLQSDASVLDLVKVVRETCSATIVVFRSLFSFLTTPTKASKWSLVSKLVTKSSKREAEILNEVSGVDSSIQFSSNSDVMVVQAKIQALDASLQIIEGELGCLFRCLLQNRVSLLNILTL